MPELDIYCDGEINDDGCKEINQPCKCLRASWLEGRNKCQCFALNEADKKVWACGCKACADINDEGIWVNTAFINLDANFTPTDLKPNLTVEDDQRCVCGIVEIAGHFCGTCPQCKDTCKIYG